MNTQRLYIFLSLFFFYSYTLSSEKDDWGPEPDNTPHNQQTVVAHVMPLPRLSDMEMAQLINENINQVYAGIILHPQGQLTEGAIVNLCNIRSQFYDNTNCVCIFKQLLAINPAFQYCVNYCVQSIAAYMDTVTPKTLDDATDHLAIHNHFIYDNLSPLIRQFALKIVSTTRQFDYDMVLTNNNTGDIITCFEVHPAASRAAIAYMSGDILLFNLQTNTVSTIKPTGTLPFSRMCFSVEGTHLIATAPLDIDRSHLKRWKVNQKEPEETHFHHLPHRVQNITPHGEYSTTIMEVLSEGTSVEWPYQETSLEFHANRQINVTGKSTPFDSTPDIRFRRKTFPYIVTQVSNNSLNMNKKSFAMYLCIQAAKNSTTVEDLTFMGDSRLFRSLTRCEQGIIQQSAMDRKKQLLLKK